MRTLGFVLAVVGGAWIGMWLVERLFIRVGIYQALGDTRTAQARAESDARGKRRQQQIAAILRRGLIGALTSLVCGIVLLIAS